MEKSGQHSTKERNKHKQHTQLTKRCFSVLMQTDNSVNEDVFSSVDGGRKQQKYVFVSALIKTDDTTKQLLFSTDGSKQSL